MATREIKIPWILNESRRLSRLQRINASHLFKDTGVLVYDSEHNRYYVDQEKVPWWKWFSMEIRFRHLMKAWPFIHGRVLEIGCQGKPFRLLFERLSEHYWGFEFLNHVRDGRGDAVVHENWLPIQSQSVETIVGLDILRRVNDPRAFLQQVYSALKPEGHLILWISHGASLLLEDDAYFDFSPKSLHNLVESVGLQIEHESTLVGKGIIFLQNGMKLFSPASNYLDAQKSILSRAFLSAQSFYLKHFRQKYHPIPSSRENTYPIVNGFKLSTLVVGRKL
ncbi:MAG: class I SAM-dependent methyltransferase [Calditrichaeota bacterium]|nr:class I SAM-dependent methyltransferase [Calditrichota bacterium]